MRPPRRTTLWLAALLATAPPASAGLAVIPQAAHTGTYGLRATIEPPCDGDEVVLVAEPVTTRTEVDACREAVAAAEVRAGGDLVLTAGRRVAFTDGFSVASGGRLAAGTTGTWRPSHVIDETPNGEPRLHVRWHARLDGLNLGPGGQVTLLRVVAGGAPRGRVLYTAGAGGGAVHLEVLGDDGTRHSSEGLPLGSGWHRLDLTWRSGTLLDPTGLVQLTADAGPATASVEAALATAGVDALELGAVEADTAAGWLDVDDYATGEPTSFATSP